MNKPSAESYRWIRPCTKVWLILMALTLVTLTIGELGLSGMPVIAFLMTMTFIKGRMVADYFMGLKMVAWRWRIIVLLYLVIVCTLIAIAYYLSLGSQ